MARVAADDVTGHEPWHRFDLALAKHYTPSIRSAMRTLIGDLSPAVRAYVARARGSGVRLPHRHELHPAVKAYGSHGDPAAQAAARQAARAALEDLAAGNYAPLLEILTELYGDSYIAGAHAAAAAAVAAGASGAVVASGFGALDGQISWDSWSPGWGEAANELAGSAGGRGLEVLLANANVTIQGITGTTLDRLAALLAEGVEAGANVDTIAGSIEAFVSSSWRAELIAITEVARAMSAATLDTYRSNGIQAWDWLTTPGACEICEDEEADNPHTLDDDPPPGHPRCRCVASPNFTLPAA